MPVVADRIASLLPADLPAEGGVGFVADVFGLTPGAVKQAIYAGKLPARSIPAGNGRLTYVIDMADAALVWGYRLLDTRRGMKQAAKARPRDNKNL